MFPFLKKDGGIRPIAVGLTLRRLVAKMANRHAMTSCAAILQPTQLGVGCKGGGEALIHASRRLLANLPEDKAFVKLDMSNAFNSVRRDSVLEAVAKHRPDILPFTVSAYGSPSILWAGNSLIESSEGVQQGDPLGPLLFSLALDPVLKSLHCDFISGYLDDVGMVDTIPSLITQIRVFEAAALEVGLKLNHAKCEVIGLSSSLRSLWDESGLNFQIRPVEEASLLGAPLSAVGTDRALLQCCENLADMKNRLLKLPSHEAFFC